MAPEFTLTETSSTAVRKRPVALRAAFLRLSIYAPQAVFVAIAAAVLAAVACRIAVKYSFNVQEGWNAYWAATAWSGGDLYPPSNALKLNNYLPLWFYVTGSLGSLLGDNIIAGRIVAGAAMLGTAVAVFLIVHAMTGRRRDGVTAAAAFLAMCGLFYGQYAAANDPQWTGNLLTTLAMLAVVRKTSNARGAIPIHLVVPLLLIASLFKQSVFAAPASIAIYLLLFRTPEFPRFVLWSIVGLAVVCAGLFLVFGPGVFASILYTRRYDLDVAWDQTIDHLKLYGPLLAVIAFLGYLATQRNSAAALIFIYSIVALIQGFVLSGGFDVDVNVFFDLAIACSIGLGLLQNAIARFFAREPRPLPATITLLVWLGIGLTPAVSASDQALTDAREILRSAVVSSQQADVAYIKSTPGGAVCQNLALCYWAGKDLLVDVDTLKLLVTRKPQLEAEFIANLERCLYPLIQLEDDWDDEDEGPFTEGMLTALETYYAEVAGGGEAYYRVPRPNCGVAAGGETGPAQRAARPENRSRVLAASAALLMR